jgi:hypothetical protein
MAENVAAYPLQWPAARKRRPPAQRKSGKFNAKTRNNLGWAVRGELTVAAALDRLQSELDRIGARLPVVSSNVETRLDKRPRSDQREPDDPGVAVYFTLDDKPHCLPCDTYTKVAANIAAVAAHIEATRAIERHGVASVSEMFSGFAALPPPGPRPWREILGLPAGLKPSRDEIDRARRALAARHHPDAGGSSDLMAEINAAHDAALKEIGNG